MKKPIVIGLVAPKEAGKTTTTNMMAEFINIKESAFADKLKNVCSKASGIPRVNFDDQSLKEVPFEKPVLLNLTMISQILDEYGAELPETSKLQHLIDKPLVSPRHIAQIVGTELLRDLVSRNVHIDNVPIYNDAVTVISDTRFENEYDVMKDKDNIDYYPAYIYRKEAEEAA